MTELLTAAQMRAIEQAAIESGEVTGLELMERAGQGVVTAILEEWPELEHDGYRALVLCGPGNNGGDGFVVARLLHQRDWKVDVFLYGDAEKLPPDAAKNYEKWIGMGEVRLWDDRAVRDFYEGDEESKFLVVDALFGTGLKQIMPEDTEEMWRGFMPAPLLSNAQKTDCDRFVAVDIPSGICSDSGRDFGALPANLTVTFHSAKVGHYMSQNCENYGGAHGCGKLKVASIGLTRIYPKGCVELLDKQKVPLSKSSRQHKFSSGHAVVVSGGLAKTGAARLSARGALRVGAGLVTVGSPRAALAENAAHLTAIMLRQIDGVTELTELLEDKRINALCLGPGLGRSSDKQALVISALQAKRATVLDADALTMFGENPQALFDLLHDKCVLTPHGGEFAKLFPDLAEKLAAPAEVGPAFSKVDATRAAAERAGCVVLYKGADTVIAAPDGRCVVNSALYERSAPWLATAGAGDVLSGFITGLLARGQWPMQAAEIGAWLHVECALEFGSGLIAEDLPEMLPAIFSRLEQQRG